VSGKPVVLVVICTAQSLVVVAGVGVQLGYTDETKLIKNIDGAANKTLSLKQVFETASHVRCECARVQGLSKRLKTKSMGHCSADPYVLYSVIFYLYVVDGYNVRAIINFAILESPPTPSSGVNEVSVTCLR
jgi:hypothetical protein